MTRDPEVEIGAIELAWLDAPCALLPRLSERSFGHKMEWWRARSDRDRDLYRYRASIVLEAVDAWREAVDAAE